MLNLLPPKEKKLLTQEGRKRLFIVLCFELLVFLGCVFLVLLAIEFYSLGEVASQNFLLEQAGAESRSLEFLYFRNVMQDYNQKLVAVVSFNEKKKFLSSAIKDLLEVQRPLGLYFTKFSMEPQDRSDGVRVIITGVSDTRENLIIFKDNIEAKGSIKNVNFSPESWISQKDVIFNLTLDVINDK